MKTADAGVLGIVAFAALAWGANENWAMAVIVAATLLVLAAVLVRKTWRDELSLPRNPVLPPLLLLLAILLVQILRFDPGLEPQLRYLPFTVERHSTVLYSLLALSCVSIIWLVSEGSRERRHVKMGVLALVALGVFEAVYGLVQYLGDFPYIWDFRVTGGVARGTFINRNHYALFLNLCICAGTGYLYYQSLRLLHGRPLSPRRVLSATGSGRLAWLLLCLALMGLALVFSMSRMGIVAMFASLGVMIIAGGSRARGGRTALLGFALLLAILSLVLHTGVDEVVARFEAVADTSLRDHDRIPIWRDAWPLILQQPIWGHGLGTFQWTFPAFERLEPDVPAKYAHNDYLQAAAEVGIVGLSILLWAFAACWKVAFRNLKDADDPLVRGIGLGTIGLLTAVGLQELTDFSLYIPGVAVTFACLVGLNLRVYRDRATRY